jgi:lipoprotein-releasing system permease protein
MLELTIALLATGILALLAGITLVLHYRFERFVGIRYLRRTQTGRAVRIGLWVALGTLGLSLLAIFLAHGHHRGFETAATVGALVTGLAVVLFLLLRLFSVFTTVSTMGVMLGVSSLTVVLAVTSGFDREFKDKVISVNAHIIVTTYGIERPVEEAEEEARQVRKKLAGMPGLLHISRFSFTAGEVMIGSVGANLKGIELEDGAPELRRALREGSVDDLGKPAHCPQTAGTDPAAADAPVGRLILGNELARKIRAKLGDCLQVLVPFSGNMETAPSASTFRVVGIFSFGFNEYDSRLGYIHLDDARNLGNARQSIFGEELRFSDPMKALELEGEVESRLGPEMNTLNWKALNRNLFTALAMQKLAISLFLLVIIIVAAFNILASLMLIVLSKVREIAILNSIGAKRGAILRIFLVAGCIVGFIGTGLGIAYGLGICGLAQFYGYSLDPKVYLIAQLPVDVSGHELLLVAGVTQIICFLATLYPAWRAAQQPVVQGLKNV